jgi:hypothetical protein
MLRGCNIEVDYGTNLLSPSHSNYLDVTTTAAIMLASLNLDVTELTNESGILRVPAQQSAKTLPLLPVCVKVEDFNKLVLDIVDPKDGHWMWSKHVIATRSTRIGCSRGGGSLGQWWWMPPLTQ